MLIPVDSTKPGLNLWELFYHRNGQKQKKVELKIIRKCYILVVNFIPKCDKVEGEKNNRKSKKKKRFSAEKRTYVGTVLQRKINNT